VTAKQQQPETCTVIYSTSQGNVAMWMWFSCGRLFDYYHHTTTTILRPFFQDHLGEPVPEENF